MGERQGQEKAEFFWVCLVKLAWSELKPLGIPHSRSLVVCHLSNHSALWWAAGALGLRKPKNDRLVCLLLVMLWARALAYDAPLSSGLLHPASQQRQLRWTMAGSEDHNCSRYGLWNGLFWVNKLWRGGWVSGPPCGGIPEVVSMLASHLGLVNSTKGICNFLDATSWRGSLCRYLVSDIGGREVTQNMRLKPDCQNAKPSSTTQLYKPGWVT